MAQLNLLNKEEEKGDDASSTAYVQELYWRELDFAIEHINGRSIYATNKHI